MVQATGSFDGVSKHSSDFTASSEAAGTVFSAGLAVHPPVRTSDMLITIAILRMCLCKVSAPDNAEPDSCNHDMAD